MATTITFPQISKDAAAEGVLSTWLVRDGEQVAAGHILAEVMVDKVAMDVEAPHAGVVRLLVAEEDAVSQGQAIAQIE